MQSVTRKIDELGRILIPARFRRELSIQPGSAVILRREGGKLTVQTREQALRDAQAFARSLVAPGVSVVDEFIAERREAARRELED
jgi:AbrB family looped-hinge helix DNA binding protein